MFPDYKRRTPFIPLLGLTLEIRHSDSILMDKSKIPKKNRRKRI